MYKEGKLEIMFNSLLQLKYLIKMIFYSKKFKK